MNAITFTCSSGTTDLVYTTDFPVWFCGHNPDPVFSLSLASNMQIVDSHGSVCRNLLFLKKYDGDVGELGLDFTVVNNDLGEAQIEETGSLVAGRSWWTT